MIITACRTNHIENPVGFLMNTPVFSWKTEQASGTKQEAARIVIRQNGESVYDSGWTDLDPLGTPVSLSLQARTRYTWTVSVRSDAGEEAESEEQFFETGMMDTAWIAEWITTDDNDEPRHPVFRRSFIAEGNIRSARLYITAQGLYEAKINGKKVGTEYLTPYCNAYDRWLQVQTYDVTASLQKENTLEVMLGNGWYRGRFGFSQSEEPAYGDTWKLLAELRILYEDGSEQIVATGKDWTFSRSKIIFSNIYDGEIEDQTLEDVPERPAVVTGADAVLCDRLSLPVIEHEHFRPSILITPKNETVLDMGQNFAGTFALKVREPAGTRIRLQFSEVMQDDCFYRDNLRTAKAEYILTTDGRTQTITPHFTFYGCRYIRIEGISVLKEDDCEGIALYSAFDLRGTLQTGHEKVNRLIRNAEWGMKSNYLDVPTDCPQRDERMGWTGDAQVFAPTAEYLADPYAFFTKYLYDMAKEQEARDGMVPVVVPAFGNDMCACAWGDATCLIPWTMYRYEGDPSILKQHYPAMKSWVEYIRRTDGDDHGWRKHFHFGDWLALDGPQDAEAVKGATDDGFCADVCYRRSALILADTAELLGYREDAKEYRKLADTITQGILDEYYTPNGRCAVMTQTAQALSIEEGLGSFDQAKKILAKLLRDAGGKLQTGFIGTPILCEALTKAGMNNEAYDLLLNENYPGWLYEVNMGATTIWERWNSIDETGHISGTGMNSLNHYAYGSVVHWIWQRCAGLRPLEPGFRKAAVAPVIDPALGEISAVYPSAAGTWKVHWQIMDRDRIRMEVTVPFGCTAELTLPLQSSTQTLTAGTYSYDYKPEVPAVRLITLDTLTMEALKNSAVKEYLESLPLFKQSEFSMGNMVLADAVASCGFVGDELKEIEKKIIALQ